MLGYIAATRVFERSALGIGLEVQEATDTETGIEVAFAWGEPTTVSGATIDRVLIPRTAADHSPLARIRTLWIVFRTALVVVSAVPVPTPLPDIAMHIKQSESVGQVRGDRARTPEQWFPRALRII